MKRIISSIFLCFFVGIALYGFNPITNPFRPIIGFNEYPSRTDDYYTLATRCREYTKYSNKQIDKIIEGFNKICSSDPVNKYGAMCYVGYYYIMSDGTKLNYNQGFNLLKEGLDYITNDKNAPEGNLYRNSFLSDFNAVLGYAYLTGKGTPQNFELAYYHYDLANKYISLKHVMASVYCKLLGIGTDTDFEGAMKLSNFIRFANFTHLSVDIEHFKYLKEWDDNNNIETNIQNVFRNAMISWLVNNNYNNAKELFEQAINLGHLPSMCELGMMFLDEDWGIKDGEDNFEKYMLKAGESGYPIGYYILGNRILKHWGKNPSLSSSNEGKAYPYFVAADKLGFQKARSIVLSYENGTYSKKKGLAATLSDINDIIYSVKEENNSLGFNKNVYSSSSSSTPKNSGTNNNSSSKNSNNSINFNSDNSNYNSSTYSSSSYNSSTTVNKKTSANKQLVEKTFTICKYCSGTGKIKCGWCHGKGHTGCPGCQGKGYSYKRKCTLCNGSGREKCRNCYGKGTIRCDVCKGEGHY